AAGAPAASTPEQNRVGLVNLATGEKLEFDHVRRFAFNGDKPTWIAMQSYPEQPSADAAGGARGGAANAASAGSRASGTDLLLYHLGNQEMVNVGNVAEFDFDDSGEWLAYTIDAHDEIGNGVQLRNLRTDVVRPLDTERALYRHLVWADSAPALAVLRGVPDSLLHDTLYSVVSVTNIAAATPKKV